MTTVAFGLEILIHKIEYLKVSSFPSLTLIVDDNAPLTLIPYSREAKAGDVWVEEKGFQMMYVLDAFETCVTWPVTFELVSPVETTALGKVTFEVKPLICDAIAAHGSSPVVIQKAILRDFERKEMATLSFELRVIFFRMTMKKAAKETTEPLHLTQEMAARTKATISTRRPQPMEPLKATSNYKFLPALSSGVMSSSAEPPPKYSSARQAHPSKLSSRTQPAQQARSGRK